MPYLRSTPIALETFESQLDPTILARGKAYFDKNAVTQLASNQGRWSAVVTGSEKYQVEIKLTDELIDACSCDCPHNADFCKHIVAVLYAIASPEKKVSAQVSAAGSSGRALYTNMVRKAINTASYGFGTIDYEDIHRFTGDINRLLTQAKTALRNRQFADAKDIAFAIIAELIEIIGFSEGKGHIQGCMEDAFALLEKLKTAADVPADFRQRLLEETAEEAKKTIYADYGFDEEWDKINSLPGR